MAKILFYGDPHGVWRPLRESLSTDTPDAIILLGDCDLERPLSDELGGAWPAVTNLFFILGNHEADKPAFFENLTSALPATNHLNAQVVNVGGLRIAGLSGTFDQDVWHPDLN